MIAQIFSVDFFHSAIRTSTPIIFAGIGALIAQQAGILNLALEGIMLVSALSGVLASAFIGTSIMGVIFGILSGLVMGIILWYISIHLKTDLYLTGIALNLFATGSTVFVMFLFTGDKGTTSGKIASSVIPNLYIPIIENIPFLGDIISGHNILTYFAFLSIIIVYYFIYKTPYGLRIRSVGENENAAKSVGINTNRIKLLAILLSSAFCALGGIYLSMGSSNYFIRDMTAGRGFIGLSAATLGNFHPFGTLIASIIFGFSNAFSFIGQSLKIPVQFVNMIPYLTTIIGLIIYSIKNDLKNKNLKKVKKNE